jgi:superfamily II DNA or RNA helicase
MEQALILCAEPEFVYNEKRRLGEIGQPKLVAIGWRLSGEDTDIVFPTLLKTDRERKEILQLLESEIKEVSINQLTGHNIKTEFLVLQSEWARLFHKPCPITPKIRRYCTMLQGAKTTSREGIKSLYPEGKRPTGIEPILQKGGKGMWLPLLGLTKRIKCLEPEKEGPTTEDEEEWDPNCRIQWVQFCEEFLKRKFPERPKRPGGNYNLPKEITPIPLDGKTIRPRQKTLVEKAIQAWGTHASILGVAPTGTGKTFMFCEIAWQFLKANPRARVLIIQHRDVILHQNKKSMEAHGIDHIGEFQVNTVIGKTKSWEGNIICASIQTLQRPKQLETLKTEIFDLAIFDEAHHATSSGYEIVQKKLVEANPKILFLGMTATPLRSDNAGLEKTFDAVFDYISYAESENEGWLVKPNVKICPLFDKRQETELLNLKMDPKTGDLDPGEIGRVLNTHDFNQWVVETWLKESKDRKTVFFCCNVEHSKAIHRCFLNEGIKSALLLAEHIDEEREEILQNYEEGETQVLVNCMVLTEGWDSQNTRAIGILRPTLSKALFLQMIGRGLRINPKDPNKKDCLILDMSYCSIRHEHFEVWPDGIPDISGDEGTTIREFNAEAQGLQRDSNISKRLQEKQLKTGELLNGMRFIWTGKNQAVAFREDRSILVEKTETPNGEEMWEGILVMPENGYVRTNYQRAKDAITIREWMEYEANKDLSIEKKARGRQLEQNPKTQEIYQRTCGKIQKPLEEALAKAQEEARRKEILLREKIELLPPIWKRFVRNEDELSSFLEWSQKRNQNEAKRRRSKELHGKPNSWKTRKLLENIRGDNEIPPKNTPSVREALKDAMDILERVNTVTTELQEETRGAHTLNPSPQLKEFLQGDPQGIKIINDLLEQTSIRGRIRGIEEWIHRGTAPFLTNPSSRPTYPKITQHHRIKETILDALDLNPKSNQSLTVIDAIEREGLASGSRTIKKEACETALLKCETDNSLLKNEMEKVTRAWKSLMTQLENAILAQKLVEECQQIFQTETGEPSTPEKIKGDLQNLRAEAREATIQITEAILEKHRAPHESWNKVLNPTENYQANLTEWESAAEFKVYSWNKPSLTHKEWELRKDYTRKFRERIAALNAEKAHCSDPKDIQRIEDEIQRKSQLLETEEEILEISKPEEIPTITRTYQGEKTLHEMAAQILGRIKEHCTDDEIETDPTIPSAEPPEEESEPEAEANPPEVSSSWEESLPYLKPPNPQKNETPEEEAKKGHISISELLKIYSVE